MKPYRSPDVVRQCAKRAEQAAKIIRKTGELFNELTQVLESDLRTNIDAGLIPNPKQVFLEKFPELIIRIGYRAFDSDEETEIFFETIGSSMQYVLEPDDNDAGGSGDDGSQGNQPDDGRNGHDGSNDGPKGGHNASLN